MFWDGPQGRVNMHIYICQHWVVTGDPGTLLKDFFGIWIFFEFGFAMFSGEVGRQQHVYVNTGSSRMALAYFPNTSRDFSFHRIVTDEKLKPRIAD